MHVGPNQHMQGQPGQPMMPMQHPPPQQHPNQYYYHQAAPDGYGGQRPGLPPGAMAPKDQQQQNWMSPISPQRRNPSPNPPDRRSQSPPSHGQYSPQKNPLQQLQHQNTSQESLGERNGGFRSPGRSLSANASSPSPPLSNGAVRKGNSAHATANYSERRPRTAEGRSPSEQEEDVPLAVWQQQRRK